MKNSDDLVKYSALKEQLIKVENLKKELKQKDALITTLRSKLDGVI